MDGITGGNEHDTTKNGQLIIEELGSFTSMNLYYMVLNTVCKADRIQKKNPAESQ